MRELDYDVAVIGAGTAGLFARRAAAEAGARTVLIEGGEGGTTCVRCGCIPSKLILAAADAARAARSAGVFGVRTGEVSIDGPAVMRRLHAVRADFLASITRKWDGLAPHEKLHGWARFTGPGELAVGDDVRLRARAVVLAVGGAPQVAEALKPAGELVLTNQSVFELEDLPSSMAVVGAGPVGIELAVAFARLGVRVTVFDKSHAPGALRDEAVAACARELLGAEVEMVLGVEVSARADGAEAVVSWRGGDGRSNEARFARVLAASGRSANLERLSLNLSGAPLDQDGAPVVDPSTLRCGDAPVFVAGDARGDLPVLHQARAEGEAAGRAAAFPQARPLRRRVPLLAITFTDPDLASVGDALAELGEGAVVGEARFEEGRATLEAQPKGLIRLYARPDGVIVGAEMAGPAVEHLAQLVAHWVAEGLTAADALARPFYHPTFEEDLRAAVKDLLGKLEG